MMSRHRAGFSLIEMMFVCLVVGVLTLIAVPRIRDMKRRAYITMLTHDVRNFANTEELYWEDANTYSSSLVDLKFQPSLDVTLTIPEATPTGFSGKAEHVPSGTYCTVFYGTAAPVAPATVKTEIACAWP
jgi:prepilin-type N-terminal cleavage/methylation domain-containing protein